MSNYIIYNKWTEFIITYHNYFLDNDTEWYNNLDLVKQYIDENKKRPPGCSKNNNIKSLGTWISTQQQNYKNKKYIMLNENIYNKWSEFINDEKYKDYFLDNETEWYNKLELVKKYINENNKIPSRNDVKSLSTWIYTQQNNYKNKKEIMSNENIYNKWTDFINTYQEYFLDNETEWNNKLDLIKKYIDENKKRPCGKDKINEIQKLGTWIQTQIINYKNKKYIMSNENIYNKWTEFINNDKYKIYFLDYNNQWFYKLQLVIKYIDENNKRPNEKDKNKEIKLLGKWISVQQQNYKNKKHTMKNENIYNKWNEFINNRKYNKYFSDYETEWYNNLEELKKYIDENNKRPIDKDKNSEIKKLAKWLSHQQQNYKNKEHLMKNETIYNKWTYFINENNYKKYFLDNKNIWNNNLELVKKYINENNKRPSQIDKNDNIKKLGIWLSHQKKNYINKKEIMKNKWTEFINDNKYKNYFNK